MGTYSHGGSFRDNRSVSYPKKKDSKLIRDYSNSKIKHTKGSFGSLFYFNKQDGEIAQHIPFIFAI